MAIDGRVRLLEDVVIDGCHGREIWVISGADARVGDEFEVDRIAGNPPWTLDVRVIERVSTVIGGTARHRLRLQVLTEHDGSTLTVGGLVRAVPVSVVQTSEGGCLLSSRCRIEDQTTGNLEVVVSGINSIEPVRVRRCDSIFGRPLYHVAVEFLGTRAETGWLHRALTRATSESGVPVVR